MNTAELLMSPADELLERPDAELFEVVNGEIVEREMGALSGWIGGEILGHLRQYARQRGGWAFGDGIGYRCYEDDPDRVRRPDASFIDADRLPEIPTGYIDIAPDLAVEVVSPNDLYLDVEAKAAEYLAAGVRLVWVVDPASRKVRIFRPDANTIELTHQERLTGGNVLPGFECTVSDFFPPQVSADRRTPSC